MLFLAKAQGNLFLNKKPFQAREGIIDFPPPRLSVKQPTQVHAEKGRKRSKTYNGFPSLCA